MPIEKNIMEVARRFARALDRDDYETVRSMLAADCCYVARDETLFGRDAITASYRENSRLARALFDQVEYSSSVTESADGRDAGILFSDHLRHRGGEHIYKCLQIIGLNSDGLIRSIHHQELPGQRENLLQFCALNGIELSE